MSVRAATGIPLGRRYVLGDLVERYGGRVDEGASTRTVESLRPVHEIGGETDLVVVVALRYVQAALRCPGVLLCTPELATRLPPGGRWVHDDAWWVVHGLLERLTRCSTVPAEAVGVHPDADVDASCVIGAGAVVHADARIGPRCVIGEHAVIYGGARLGSGVVVGPGAVIGRAGFGWARTPSGDLFRIPHVAGVIVDDDVEIGALCTVDAGTLSPTRIGRSSKIDAHVHVAHNVRIGEGVLVAAQAGFAGSSVIGAGVEIGGQAGVTNHARVGGGARIAAKSGVIGDVPERAVVAGFPAVSRMRWLRSMAALLRLGEGNRR